MHAKRISLTILVASLLLPFTACKGKPVVGPETTDAEIRVQNIGGWYTRFVKQNARSPRDRDEFFAYHSAVSAWEVDQYLTAF